MKDQDYIRTLESQRAIDKAEIRHKDDLIRSLQLQIEKLKAAKVDSPEPDNAAIRLEVLNELEPLMKAKDDRIEELERQLEAKAASATASERESIRKEVFKEFQSELERRDQEIEALHNQLKMMDAVIASLQDNLDDKSQKAQDLKVTVKIHTNSEYGQSSETIDNLINNRDKTDLRALEELSFDGKEVEGMTPEEREKLKAYHQSLEPQDSDDGVESMIEKAMEEMGVEPEPKKKQARRTPKQSSGLSSSIRKQIKDELKSTLGDINLNKVRFHLIDDDHPLPPNAQPMLKKDGTPDTSLSIVVTCKAAEYEVHVYQEGRVKLRRDDIVVTGEGGSDGLELKGEVPHKLPRLSDKVFADPQNETVTQENIELLMDKKVFTSMTAEPQIHRKALNTCIFDNETLGFILREKYMYGSTFESIRDRIRDGGINIPKTTLNENIHRFIDMLKSGLDQCFVEKIRKSDCLNIDETCVIVATPVEKTNDKGEKYQVTEYMKKYMWVFVDKEEDTTYYRYEEGSRSRKVLLDVLGKDYHGTITTDGYVGYLIFDKDGGWSETVLHTGCWTHARRYLVYMLLENNDKAMELIKLIRDMFVYEAIMKKTEMTPERRCEYRKIHSVPIMNQIFQLAEEYQKDPVIMAGERSRTAINYLLNQRKPLQNFVLDGRAEISNNLAERMVKPIKRMLRNCLFMGSPEAASRHAFMFSLFETLKLMHIDQYSYLKALLGALQRVPYIKPYNEGKISELIRRLAAPYLPWKYKKGLSE